LYRELINRERDCFHSAAHVVTFTERSRRSLIEDYGLPEDKASVNYPGIPMEPFLALKRPRPEGGRVRLLFVGNEFKRKGGWDVVEVYFRAFSDVCEFDIVTRDQLDLPKVPGLRIHHGVKA